MVSLSLSLSLLSLSLSVPFDSNSTQLLSPNEQIVSIRIALHVQLRGVPAAWRCPHFSWVYVERVG